MTARGKAARAVAFARDFPQRALALIPVDGELQAHSWDLVSGETVRATEGIIRDPLITPDGQWLWWFDRATNVLWRRPFGASSRGRQEPPLRLRPIPHTRVLAGGDGTAIVARTLPGTGVVVSLLPIGRVRPGAEPTLIMQAARVGFLARSRDDDLLAVETDRELVVYQAHSGAVLTSQPTDPEHSTVGFTADGSLLMTHSAPGHGSRITTLLVWNPRTGLRRSLSLDAVANPICATLTHDGRGVLIESVIDDVEGAPRIGVHRGRIDAWEPAFAGPLVGSITPGSLTSDGRGNVYGVWRGERAAERFIRIDPAAEPGHGGYPPVVGGVGW